MKKALLYMGIALAAIGCAKDEATISTLTSGEINLSAGIATRVASDDDCAWKSDDQVGIFTDQLGESNLCFTISDAESGALNNDSGVDICPLLSGKRTYYAYHPYDSEQNETTTIDIDCTTEQSEPLLWATATSNDVEVALQFAHKFAKVQFSLTAGGVDVTSLEDAKACLTGANAKATFDIKSGEFSEVLVADINLTIKDDRVVAYLPPMDAVSGDVKLCITAGGNTFVKTITTEKWESGSSYAYDITIGEVLPPVDYSAIATVNSLLGTTDSDLRLSNCYMVSPAEESTYIIPVGSRINTYWGDSEYGSDSSLLIGSDWTSNSDYTIEPLWNDFDLADYTGQITFSKVSGTDDPYAIKITFADGFSYAGNMVIAVKKGDIIVWSWHIWITDYNPYTKSNGTTYAIDGYGTWMDRNIGARSTAYSDGEGNLYYQWGRKDPLTPSVATASAVSTIADAVKAPEYFYLGSDASDYDWCGSSDDYDQDRDHNWRDAKLASTQDGSGVKYGSTKSIYDPSPLGFMVPTSLSTTSWSSPFTFISSSTWTDNGRTYNGDANIPIFFPALGCLYYTSGDMTDVGTIGYSWSSMPNSDNYSYGLYFRETIVFDDLISYRAFGFPVRPIQE